MVLEHDARYDLSVVVFCHNVRESIRQCDEELTAVLSTLALQIELLYVDNASIDDTLFQLKNIISESPRHPSLRKRVISLRQEQSGMVVFMAAKDHTVGRLILTIDPDLTVDPLHIVALLDEYEKGYDMIIGWRRREHLSKLIQVRSSVVNRITSWITGVKLHDYGTNLRLVSRDILEGLSLAQDLYPFLPALLHRVGARIGEVSVPYRSDRYIGWEYTPFGIVRSFWEVINLWFMQRFSRHPLYLFGSIGIVFILIAVILFFIAVINRWSTGVTLIQTPLPTLAGGLLVLGIQTILLGFTTELIMRTYLQGSTQPLYFVRESFDDQL